jgi:hypothetical protein
VLQVEVRNSNAVSCINFLNAGVHVTADHYRSILSLLIVDKIQTAVLVTRLYCILTIKKKSVN